LAKMLTLLGVRVMSVPVVDEADEVDEVEPLGTYNGSMPCHPCACNHISHPTQQECRNTGMQEYRNAGIQECGNTGIQECRNAG
jgi:hypothetical protein